MRWIPASAAIVFWACSALVFYADLAYPLLIWALSRAARPRAALPRAAECADGAIR